MTNDRLLNQTERVQLADDISQAGIADAEAFMGRAGVFSRDVTVAQEARVRALLAEHRGEHRHLGGPESNDSAA